MMVSVVVIVDVCDTVDAADVFFSSFSIHEKLDLQSLLKNDKKFESCVQF